MSSRQDRRRDRQKQKGRYRSNRQAQNKYVTQQDILRKHHKFLRQSSNSSSNSNSNSNSKNRSQQKNRSARKPYLNNNPSNNKSKPTSSSTAIYDKYGQTLARKYYSKLYKEYALVDLSRYETGQIGCRWRTETEVLAEKGERICAQVNCRELVKGIYEMNFGYLENGQKKNALVKISLCQQCAEKLNHKKKHRKIQQSSSKDVKTKAV